MLLWRAYNLGGNAVQSSLGLLIQGFLFDRAAEYRFIAFRNGKGG